MLASTTFSTTHSKLCNRLLRIYLCGHRIVKAKSRSGGMLGALLFRLLDGAINAQESTCVQQLHCYMPAKFVHGIMIVYDNASRSETIHVLFRI